MTSAPVASPPESPYVPPDRRPTWPRWRPAMRLAVRDARAHQGRSALILALVALPVGLLVGAALWSVTRDTSVGADPVTDGLIACFEDDGVVHSPFLGTMRASDFFKKLAQASSGSVITVLDLFASAQPSQDGSVRVAAYFRYDWTLNDGREVTFTCVDVFTFDAGSTRIRDMNIVYDTHPLREEVGDKYAPD